MHSRRPPQSYIPSGRDARGKANEIFGDKGIFHYHDREFEKGSMMTVQAARDPAAPKEKEPESWTGVVTFVSPAEVRPPLPLLHIINARVGASEDRRRCPAALHREPAALRQVPYCVNNRQVCV